MSELSITNRSAAVTRYYVDEAVYQEIYGDKAVWCRPIPHITKK